MYFLFDKLFRFSLYHAVKFYIIIDIELLKNEYFMELFKNTQVHDGQQIQ